jgi:uncharacterized protein YqeY
MLESRLQSDLKQALLGGDKTKASVLRMLKSVIGYAKVENRDRELTDQDIEQLLAREVKRRQESAVMYEKGGALEKRDQELAEKAIIEAYLPEQMEDDELEGIISDAVADLGPLGPQTMGRIIGSVKQRAQGRADSGRIAAAVKARIDQEANL